MKDTPSYVLPSDTEKLSGKYILDSLRARRQAEEEVTPETVAEAVQEAAVAAALVPAPELPVPANVTAERKYFRIAQVAEIVGVKPHVLRYWETEFTMIRPSKSGGQRVYRRKDVETLQLIKQLLYVEKLGIRRARKKVLEHRKRAKEALELAKKPAPAPEPVDVPMPEPVAPVVNTQLLRELVEELKDLVRIAQQG